MPGAIQTWKGRTSGGNPVTVWVSGIVKKEMLMSGSIGLGSDVSGATEETGTFEVVGDVVYICLKDGQVSARLVVEAGAIRGLKVGDSVYRAR